MTIADLGRKATKQTNKQTHEFFILGSKSQGGGGGGYSDISYIRRLGSNFWSVQNIWISGQIFWVQKFEFQYFLGFSEK